MTTSVGDQLEAGLRQELALQSAAEEPKPIANQVPRPKDPLQLMARYDMRMMPPTWRSRWFNLSPERRLLLALVR